MVADVAGRPDPEGIMSRPLRIVGTCPRTGMPLHTRRPVVRCHVERGRSAEPPLACTPLTLLRQAGPRSGPCSKGGGRFEGL